MALSVSVVIVSHGRPDALCRAITGAGQIDYLNFEIVVVADSGGAAAARSHPLASQIKITTCDTPNISMARNIGIDLAGGDIVAFIDDDAVPEPQWLAHLVKPFEDSDIAAAGGYVVGRNGISFQWTARAVGPDAQTKTLEMVGDAPQVFQGTSAQAIKTEGTNMAVRRDVLTALGGFDEAYAFYLDETDLNMRIGRAGLHTAIVPLARVHHGFAASKRRRADRVPTDLTQVGVSLAVYLRKFGQDLDTLQQERIAQRKRLLTHMVAGRLLPSDVGRLLQGFDQGCAIGSDREFGQLRAFPDIPAFQKFPSIEGPMQFLVGRTWQTSKLIKTANEMVGDGQRVTVIILSLTSLFHHMRFMPAGFWLWTGGQFGKIDREERLFCVRRFSDCIARIRSRIAG